MDQFLADLMQALEQDEGQKLGGKSAEARASSCAPSTASSTTPDAPDDSSRA